MCRTTALFALAGAMSALCNATTAPVRAPVCRRTAVRCSATLPRRGALLAAVTLPLLAYAPLALAEANYTAGPSGLQYQDTVVGTGASYGANALQRYSPSLALTRGRTCRRERGVW